MYQKSVPPELLPGLIQRANTLMKNLDLRSFDIMDYSISATGNDWANLTKPVIDAYFDNMPQAMGFVNGYVPASTYAQRDGRAMVSFEYYLSPMATEEEAVADLIELGQGLLAVQLALGRGDRIGGVEQSQRFQTVDLNELVGDFDLSFPIDGVMAQPDGTKPYRTGSGYIAIEIISNKNRLLR